MRGAKETDATLRMRRPLRRAKMTLFWRVEARRGSKVGQVRALLASRSSPLLRHAQDAQTDVQSQ